LSEPGQTGRATHPDGFGTDTPVSFSVVYPFHIKYLIQKDITESSMKNFRQSAILVVFLLIMMSGSAFAQITNANVLVPANYDFMVPPAVGATYADSVFGTTIHRVTNALNMPNHDRGGSLTWVEAEYSTMSPFNSDNSRFILIHESYFGLYDGTTGLYLSDLPMEINSSSEPRWSRKDNVTLYYHDFNQLKGYNIKTGAITVLHTFTEYKSIYGNGEMDISADGDHLVFAGDNEFIFVYEISTDKKYSVFDAGTQNFDSLYITADNQVIISWQVAGTGRLTGQELFGINMNFLRQVGHADGHKHLTVDTDGSAVLIWTNSADPNPIANCQNGIVKIRLSDAKQTCLAQLDWSLAVHISAPDGNGTVFVDTEMPADLEPTTSSWKPYTDEIIQIKLDGSGSINRWAHHRSRPSGNYNWQPKLSVSRDGTHLVYSSNFNLVKTQGDSALYGDTYMMVVPATGLTPVTTAPVTTVPVKTPAPLQPIIPTATPDAATTTVRFEQDNAAVKFTGTWYPNTAAFNSGSSATLAMDANTSATISFTGTGVKWVGFSDPWSGIAQVYIDGALKATVDTYSATQLSQTVLYSATNLTSGAHTMTVMSTGKHSTASGGAWVWVDAFDVTSLVVPPTPVTTRYEQNNSAVTYNGAWYTNAGAFNSGSSAAMGMDAGASATISFTGTSVTWIGFSDPWSGVAKVYVDGTLAATVDTYSAVQASQKVLYSAISLSNGPHTLTVMATGTHSSASAGAWVWVDAFDFTSLSSSTVSISGSPVQAASPVTSTARLQQDNSAVTYAGSWYTNNGAFNSAQSAAMAMDPTASAAISFTGTAVKWVGFSDPWSGIAHVYVDGVLGATIDTYAAVQIPQNVLYTATGLSNGPHTFRIVPTGQHSSASAGSWVWIDAFDVTSIATGQVSTGTQLISSR
jgi:hypothetical protein